MRLVKRVAITAGLVGVALTAAASAFAHDDDDWGGKHKHHRGPPFVPPGHVYTYRPAPVIIERPVVYRAMPDYGFGGGGYGGGGYGGYGGYYGPPPPPSLNINIPLR
jgi:hypothetical protein